MESATCLPLALRIAAEPYVKLILAVSELGARAGAVAAAVVVVLVRSQDTLARCASLTRMRLLLTRLRAHLFMPLLVWLALRWFRSLLW